jgi:membrane dipeptidase
MTDEMIIALAKKGGVIQINFSCGFLNQKAGAAEAAQSARMAPMLAALREKYKNNPDELEKAMEAARAAAGPPSPRATIADVVKHINHVADIAGVDAIGLGSDFDGIGCAPEGLDSVDKWPNLTRALLEEGYTQNDIIKIYGENTMRVMTQVEKVAASLK